jgi:Tetratricopeptide repeat
MGRMPWIWSLWPGLARIRHDGSLIGLIWALLFTTIVNLALVTTWLYADIELLRTANRTLIWTMIGLFWAAAVAYNAWNNRRLNHPRRIQAQADLFCTARELYLKRNWFDAHKCLTQLLRRNPQDVAGRILLVNLLLRTDRYEEAAIELDRLSRSEVATDWHLEIDRQQARLSEMVARAADEPAPEDQAIPSDSGLAISDLPTAAYNRDKPSLFDPAKPAPADDSAVA